MYSKYEYQLRALPRTNFHHCNFTGLHGVLRDRVYIILSPKESATRVVTVALFAVCIGTLTVTRVHQQTESSKHVTEEIWSGIPANRAQIRNIKKLQIHTNNTHTHTRTHTRCKRNDTKHSLEVSREGLRSTSTPHSASMFLKNVPSFGAARYARRTFSGDDDRRAPDVVARFILACVVTRSSARWDLVSDVVCRCCEMIPTSVGIYGCSARCNATERSAMRVSAYSERLRARNCDR